jgi:hypothetical protein
MSFFLPGAQVRTSRHIDGNMSADAETAQQLLSILEGESF